MSVNIDDLYEAFQAKEADLAAAISLCQTEQAKGRTGLEALHRAIELEQQLGVIAKVLTKLIDEALVGLTVPPKNYSISQ